MINFEVSSNLKDIINMYNGMLDNNEIKKALANALNRSQTRIKKEYGIYVKKTYNIDKKILNDKNGYRIQRANATKDIVESRAFITSRPISLLNFVSSDKPVTVFVKNATIMSSAFVLRQPSITGLFIREGDKVAPTKGAYAGRRIQRGERKGQLLTRQKIDKKYMTTTGQVANIGYDEVVANKNYIESYLVEALDKILFKKNNPQ